MAGDIGLRQAIADLVALTRGLTVAANDVMVVTSTQAALDLIAATLPPASAVVVEDPGYICADAAFTSRGHRIVPAPVDRDGLDVARSTPGGTQAGADRDDTLLPVPDRTTDER